MPLKPVEQPSMERAWRWHLQLMAERVFNPFRIYAMLGSAVWWAVCRHSPASHNGIEWIVLAAGIVFAFVNEIVLRFDLPIARAFPIGTVVADLALIGANLWASGGRDSPFLVFITVGVVASSLRLPPKKALVSTLGYVLLSLNFGDIDQMIPNALVLVILGFGVAMWSETMQRQHIAAVRDPLTGAYSRDFGMFRLHEAVAGQPMPFVVGVIDVDGFKTVNDLHGHAAGDIVLRQVSHIIASTLQSEDFFCRTGGDEFMTVFRNVDAAASAGLGERIRASVEGLATSMRPENAAVGVTVSIGLAEASAGVSAVNLLKAADDAMYAAKKSKNRVVIVRCVDGPDLGKLVDVNGPNSVRDGARIVDIGSANDLKRGRL
jgi:diguanylate cyclase (GGDEF)-like protein